MDVLIALVIGLGIGFMAGMFFIANVIIDRAEKGMVYIRDEKGDYKWVKYEAP